MRRIAASLPSSGLAIAIFLIVVAAVGLATSFAFFADRSGRSLPRAHGALPHEAYVWQRATTAAVPTAVRTQAAEYARLVVLAAEVSWREGRAEIVRVPLAADALPAAPSVGLALRVGAWRGSFARDDAAARELTTLARALLADAATAGLAVAELQVDFDAAESQLAGYRQWLAAVRAAVEPVPVTFTALPAWLDRPREFGALARDAGSYVLQVHALARPRYVDEAITLCDPTAAHRAVERAAAHGVPFRVALPTYGYALAFHPTGRFAGLHAEGPPPAWPADTIVRELAADPVALAALVRAWAEDRPAALTGVIWFRLPVAGDRRAWPAETLRAVRAGSAPVPRLAVTARPSPDGLVELVLHNSGDAPFRGAVHAHVRWSGAAPVAADVLAPLHLTHEAATQLELAADTTAVAPGAARVVAWLRFAATPPPFDVSLTTH